MFGIIAGSGAAVGLILGGALTEYLNWRCCIYVNLILAVPAGIAALRLLGAERAPAERPRIDIPGAITASAGLFALVYGFSNAETQGWGGRSRSSRWPPPSHCLPHSSRSSAASSTRCCRSASSPIAAAAAPILAVAIVGAGMFGVFLFLTFYMQQTLGFAPLKTGLAFLPMMAVLMPTAAIGQTRLVPRFGVRRLVTLGMVFGAVAMLILTGVTVDSDYVTYVLPGLMVMGLGLGLVMAPR